MSSFKCRKEDCNERFANTSNRHIPNGHLPPRKKASIVPEFDESKG